MAGSLAVGQVLKRSRSTKRGYKPLVYVPGFTKYIRWHSGKSKCLTFSLTEFLTSAISYI